MNPHQKIWRGKTKLIRFLAGFSIITATLCPFGAFGDEKSLGQLIKAKTIRCALGEGYSSEFDGKKLSFKKGKSKFSDTPENSIITFASIDLDKSHAILVGNNGEADLAVIPTGNGLSFMEITGSGNLVISTIFNQLNEDGNYFVVMSRHIDAFGAAIPSQYPGFCEIQNSK